MKEWGHGILILTLSHPDIVQWFYIFFVPYQPQMLFERLGDGVQTSFEEIQVFQQDLLMYGLVSDCTEQPQLVLSLLALSSLFLHV